MSILDEIRARIGKPHTALAMSQEEEAAMCAKYYKENYGSMGAVASLTTIGAQTAYTQVVPNQLAQAKTTGPLGSPPRNERTIITIQKVANGTLVSLVEGAREYSGAGWERTWVVPEGGSVLETIAAALAVERLTSP